MDMLATAGLIAVGTLTPGPNNLLVLRQASVGGWRAVAPAAGGILAGGLAVLGAVGAGAAALAAHPTLPALMRLAAAALLGILALSTLRSGPERRRETTDARGTAVFAGLFAFQFLNPKTWILATAAVASIGAPSAAALGQLAALFVLIPAASLTLWCAVGASFAGRLSAGGAARTWLDRATAGLLIAFAALLLKEALSAL